MVYLGIGGYFGIILGSWVFGYWGLGVFGYLGLGVLGSWGYCLQGGGGRKGVEGSQGEPTRDMYAMYQVKRSNDKSLWTKRGVPQMRITVNKLH